MKKERRWESCHAQVMPMTMSWMMIQRITRALVVSDWSRNSASRSCNASQQGMQRSRRTVVTDSLEDLLPTDVVEPGVEVLDTAGNVLELALVAALDLVGVADGKVEAQLDATIGAAGREPAGTSRAARRGEADSVVAGLLRGEGEAAGRLAALRHDPVVIVEYLLHRTVSNCL